MAEDNDKLLKGEDSFTSKTPPSAAYVRWLLAQGDTTSPKSPLHYLGTGASDAAPGDHKHDGRTSQYLWDPGVTIITGDLSTTAGLRTAVKGILNALAAVGMKDNTTN